MDGAFAGAVPHFRASTGRRLAMDQVMDVEDERRRHNRRTALILASIALVFFIGVIARHWFFV